MEKSELEQEIKNIKERNKKVELDKKCVDIHDRVTPLDFWVCILAFAFDLNFDVSYKIIKENDYINVLIDRFEYKDKETKSRMENIRKILNEFVDEKIIKLEEM